nr:MAG TPA: hypothetical protein [Caudoviricetes sp.]
MFSNPIFHHHLSKQKSHTKCDLFKTSLCELKSQLDRQDSNL